LVMPRAAGIRIRARLPAAPQAPRIWVAQRFQRCDKEPSHDQGL